MPWFDSAKVGKEDLTSFARLDQIDQLFTDASLSEEWTARLSSAGVRFTLCEDSAFSKKNCLRGHACERIRS